MWTVTRLNINDTLIIIHVRSEEVSWAQTCTGSGNVPWFLEFWFEISEILGICLSSVPASHQPFGLLSDRALIPNTTNSKFNILKVLSWLIKTKLDDVVVDRDHGGSWSWIVMVNCGSRWQVLNVAAVDRGLWLYLHCNCYSLNQTISYV